VDTIIQEIKVKSCLERLANSVSEKSRSRKWEQFLALMSPLSYETIVDIGVNTTEYSNVDNYLERKYLYPDKISAVAVGEDLAEFKKRYPRVNIFSSDGRKLDFDDNAFDISYSNAVIEHVGPRPDQERFLKEMFRVSRRGYLTTPNRLFPIEVHTRVPLLHILLPRSVFHLFLGLIGKAWAAGDYMNLLSERELRSLMAVAGIQDFELVPNRFLGIPMTFTVTWHKP
jgi:hypothetical protein